MTDDTTDTDDPSTEPGSLAIQYPHIYTDLEYAIAPEHEDERGYFARRALDLVRDGLTHHPEYGTIVSTLERAIESVEDGRHADALTSLRGAYSLLPYRAGADESRPSAAESGREEPNLATDGGVLDEAAATLEAFRPVPTIEDPSDTEREGARRKYPDELVPDEGPVPDPSYAVHRPALFAIPDWVVEAIAHWIYREDSQNTAQRTLDLVQEYVSVRHHFETADGEKFLEAAVDDRVRELRAEDGPELATDGGGCIDSTVQSEARKLLQAVDLLEAVDPEAIPDEAATKARSAHERLINAVDPLAWALAGLTADPDA